MPHESGVFNNHVDIFERVPTQEFWSHSLKEAGYFCSSGGKVHHRYKPVRRQFHGVLYSDGQKHFDSDMHMPPDVEKKKFGGNRGGWGTTDEKDDSSYYDHQSASSAIEFLQGYDGDEPFYREVGFYSPHGPHYTPARFKEMYEQGRFQMPAEWQNGFDRDPYADEIFPENVDPKDVRWWQASVRNYYSALSHGDYHLGRVWDALKASAHADNTVVVILSDHGFHLGNLNRYKKTTLWEQVAGVPLIIHDPGQPQPREIHDPVAMIDIGPTVQDYCNIEPRREGFGKSLRPLVEGGSDPGRTIPTFYFDNVSVRKGDLRLIRYANGDTQLYDLAQDYWQLRDLGADHPQHAEMLQALQACSRDCGYDIP